MKAVRFRPSIRVRLTAWYAALLALVLLALGASVLALAGNRLQDDMDARLFRTAEDIAGVIAQQYDARQRVDPVVTLEEVAPGLSSFSSRGLLIQVIAADGRVASRSEAAPGDPMLKPPQPDARAVAAFADEVVDDWSIRVVEYPLILRGPDSRTRPIGAVLVAERTDTRDETLASLRQVMLWTSIVGLALAAGGGWLLAGRALRPVDRITASAASIAADGNPGSLAARLPVPASGDELARLAATFNAMLDRIQAAFETQRRFVADASHELRTPLAAVRGNTEVMIRQAAAIPETSETRTDLIDAAEDVRRESARMSRLLDDLLLLARADAATGDHGQGALREPLEAVALDDLAQAAVRSAAGLADGQALAVRGTPVTVFGDRDRLLQVVLILLDNAIRHTPPGNAIEVRTGTAPEGWATVSVSDEGSGIAPEHVPRLFERFYRADDARGRSTGGVGLGLAIAQAIARAHGGEIAVSSRPGDGATFTVRLPGVIDPSSRVGTDANAPRHAAARPPVAKAGRPLSGR